MGGPISGQDPYTPFENDRVTWSGGSSETGRTFVVPPPEADVEVRRPAILLFVSGQDGASCCAANYERFVFKDKKVVELAKEQFATVRADRGGLSEDELKAWKLTRAKPALILTDSEGLIAARWDACTSASVVHAAMVQVLKRSRVKARHAEEQKKAFPEIEALLEQASFREARKRLERIAREKDGPAGGRRRAELALAALTEKAKKLVAQAEEIEETVPRYARLLVLQEEFWHDEAVIGAIKVRVKALQDGPDTAGPVREYRAMKAFEAAKAIVDKGKTGAGREALRQVQRDFPETEAARLAAEALAQR